jgi:hypothetical protein
VQDEPAWAVPLHLVQEQRADTLSADVRSQIQVFEQISVEGGVAEQLPTPHCHPSAIAFH